MSTKHIINGYIVENGKIKEINFIKGSAIKVQGIGTGSYQVVGKTRLGEYKVLSMIDNGSLDVVDTCKDNNIYTADVAGMSFVTIINLNGVENVYFDIYEE